MTPSKTRTIRLQVFVHASPRKAFKAISEPKRLSRWLVDEATISLRKGGRYSFKWEGGPTHTGRVLEFVRGKSITLTWQWPGQEEFVTTRLKMSIEGKEDGAILKFTHTGFPKQERWLDLYTGSIQGWTYFLMNFKSVLDHRHDLRSKNDW